MINTKHKIREVLIVAIAALSLTHGTSAIGYEVSISSDAEKAYLKGAVLRWQNKTIEAIPFFKYSADLGHHKAAWLYAVSKNIDSGGSVDKEYALKAAKAGNMNAIMTLASYSSPLSPSESNNWRVRADKEISQRMNQADPLAYFDRAYFMNINNPIGIVNEVDIDALKHSARLGYPPAIYALAQEVEDGEGWFLAPGSRAKETQRLYAEAAESGYPPAMSAFANVLAKSGEVKEAIDWYEKEVELGVASTIVYLAIVYSGQNNDWAEVVPQNKVKAASYYSAYFSSIAKTEATETVYNYYRDSYQELLSSMTSEEIKQSTQLAEDYLSSHTVRVFDGFWEWGVDYGERPD